MYTLTQEELESIDPRIKDIIIDLNKLYFIEKTHYSCEGHPTGIYEEDILNPAFIALQYKEDTNTERIRSFRKDMTSVPYCDGELERKIEDATFFYYHYTIHNEDQKEEVWKRIEEIIEKYMKDTQ